MLCSQLWFIAYYHIDDWIWAWHAHIRRLLFLYTCHHHHYYMSSSSSWFFFSRDIIMCVNFYFHGPRRLCVGILLSSAYLLDILLHFSLYCVYISTLCRVSLFFVDNSCLRIIIRWLSLTGDSHCWEFRMFFMWGHF